MAGTHRQSRQYSEQQESKAAVIFKMKRLFKIGEGYLCEFSDIASRCAKLSSQESLKNTASPTCVTSAQVEPSELLVPVAASHKSDFLRPRGGRLLAGQGL
jgi:hypothetical protein